MKLIEFKLTLAVPCDVDEETIKEASIVTTIRDYASNCDIEECGIELARMDNPASSIRAQGTVRYQTSQQNEVRDEIQIRNHNAQRLLHHGRRYSRRNR